MAASRRFATSSVRSTSEVRTQVLESAQMSSARSVSAIACSVSSLSEDSRQVSLGHSASEAMGVSRAMWVAESCPDHTSNDE
eukprot:3233786-Prymnesium_polylepis.1